MFSSLKIGLVLVMLGDIKVNSKMPPTIFTQSDEAPCGTHKEQSPRAYSADARQARYRRGIMDRFRVLAIWKARLSKMTQWFQNCIVLDGDHIPSHCVLHAMMTQLVLPNLNPKHFTADRLLRQS